MGATDTVMRAAIYGRFSTGLIWVALITLHKQARALPRDDANRLAIQLVLLGKLLGVPFPDLREADARTVTYLNARLDWSKVKWNAW